MKSLFPTLCIKWQENKAKAFSPSRSLNMCIYLYTYLRAYVYVYKRTYTKHFWIEDCLQWLFWKERL